MRLNHYFSRIFFVLFPHTICCLVCDCLVRICYADFGCFHFYLTSSVGARSSERELGRVRTRARKYFFLLCFLSHIPWIASSWYHSKAIDHFLWARARVSERVQCCLLLASEFHRLFCVIQSSRDSMCDDALDLLTTSHSPSLAESNDLPPIDRIGERKTESMSHSIFFFNFLSHSLLFTSRDSALAR